jgi:hypothetical protein
MSISIPLELAKGLVLDSQKYLPIVQELIMKELVMQTDQPQDAEEHSGLVSSPICSVSSGQNQDIILSSPALPALPPSTIFSDSHGANISQLSSPTHPMSSVCSTSPLLSPCNDETELEVPIYETHEILAISTGITSSNCPSSSPQSSPSPLSPLNMLEDLPLSHLPLHPLKRKASYPDPTSDIFCDSGCSEHCISDSSEYEEDPDVSPAHKAARLRGGEVQARIRRKKRRCPRKGTRAPHRADIRSGVIEGPDGPEIPDFQRELGSVNEGVHEEVVRGEDMQNSSGGAEKSFGSQRVIIATVSSLEIESEKKEKFSAKKGKGSQKQKRSSTSKSAGKQKQREDTWTADVVQAATTEVVTSLLSRFALMSNYQQCQSLVDFINTLVSDKSGLTAVDTPVASSAPTSRLASLVRGIEEIVQVAKVADLYRLFLYMNLAFEIDQ